MTARGAIGAGQLVVILATVCLLALAGWLLALGIATSWPPYVVTGDSMAPNLERGDLVFVEPLEERGPDRVREEVVTVVEGERRGYRRFGRYGDVIVFTPNASWDRGPLLHRAVRWVDTGDEWQIVNTTYTAEHAGFLTDADGHPVYDQRYEARDVVRPEWVRGVARYRVPELGHLGLWLARAADRAAVSAGQHSL